MGDKEVISANTSSTDVLFRFLGSFKAPYKFSLVFFLAGITQSLGGGISQNERRLPTIKPENSELKLINSELSLIGYVGNASLFDR